MDLGFCGSVHTMVICYCVDMELLWRKWAWFISDVQVRSEEECQGELRALGDRLLKQQGTLAYLDGRNYSYSSGFENCEYL